MFRWFYSDKQNHSWLAFLTQISYVFFAPWHSTSLVHFTKYNHVIIVILILSDVTRLYIKLLGVWIEVFCNEYSSIVLVGFCNTLDFQRAVDIHKYLGFYIHATCSVQRHWVGISYQSSPKLDSHAWTSSRESFAFTNLWVRSIWEALFFFFMAAIYMNELIIEWCV